MLIAYSSQAKLFNKERFKEKVRMNKLIKAHEEKEVEVKADEVKDGTVPIYA